MKRNASLYPYLVWTALFIIVPLVLVIYFSLTVPTDAGVRFSLQNFKRFLEPIYIKVLWRSLRLAFIATAVCLIVGYPVAMILAGNAFSRKDTLVLLFVVPMWMNFLLRTYSWMALLERRGIINTILARLGLPQQSLLYTESAVVLGMVYNFLPFMVLPIYTVLSKMDKSLIEAAQDLGANQWLVFWRVILPQSLPGVSSGITMVFMPAVTTFVISRLLGGGQFTLIGNLIEQQFLFVGDWNFGSAISVVMMVFILISMAIMSRFEGEEKGARLW